MAAPQYHVVEGDDAFRQRERHSWSRCSVAIMRNDGTEKVLCRCAREDAQRIIEALELSDTIADILRAAEGKPVSLQFYQERDAT